MIAMLIFLQLVSSLWFILAPPKFVNISKSNHMLHIYIYIYVYINTSHFLLNYIYWSPFIEVLHFSFQSRRRGHCALAPKRVGWSYDFYDLPGQVALEALPVRLRLRLHRGAGWRFCNWIDTLALSGQHLSAQRVCAPRSFMSNSFETWREAAEPPFARVSEWKQRYSHTT